MEKVLTTLTLYVLTKSGVPDWIVDPADNFPVPVLGLVHRLLPWICMQELNPLETLYFRHKVATPI